MNLLKEGRVALITGGARGIGFATARILAAEGARCVLVDVDAERVSNSAAMLSDEFGVKTLALAVDISKAEQVDMMARRAAEEFGGVDILVNSAAVLADKLFLDSSKDDWKRVLDIDLYGAFFCLHSVLPQMVARKYGRVICVASDAGRLGQGRNSYYAAAKGGVIALVKSLAQEHGRDGITLNVVCPAATDTELRREREAKMRAQMGEEKYQRRVTNTVRMYPAGRIGQPEDTAGMIAYLVSEHTSWITGQTISVNGGFSMA